MLEFVGGDDSFSCTGEALEDEGEDGAPGGGWVGVSSPGPAAFVNEGEGSHHFEEALGVLLTRSEDELRGRAVRRLTDLEGMSSRGRDAQFLTGQEGLG